MKPVKDILFNNIESLVSDVNNEIVDISPSSVVLLNTNFCPYVVGGYPWDCVNVLNGISTRGILGSIYSLRDTMYAFS